MKKLALILMILAVFTLGAVPALAADPASGAFALADYLPADMDVYFGLRADEQAIADLDGLLAKFSVFAQDFGATEVPPSVHGLLLQMQGVAPEDIDAVMAWAGDAFAYGTTGMLVTLDNPARTVIVVSLEDRAAAEEYFTSRLGNDFANTGVQGSFTVYESSNGHLLFSDDVLLAVSSATPEYIATLTSGDYPRLSAREGFAEAVSSLPDENYTLGLFMSEAVSSQLNMGMDGIAGSAAVGLGVLDGTTLAVDIYSPTAAGYEAGPIDPSFTRFIPADSNFFFHGTNLGGLIDASFDEAARAQASQVLTSAGLDLDSMLEWMSGDFAVYSRLDFASFWQPIMSGVPAGSTMQDIADGIDVGFAVETTDPEAAAQFVQALATQIRALPMEEPGSRTETQETLAGTDATVFAITPPDGSGITMRVALASNKEIFVIGTYNGVVASLAADPGIGGNALASEAAAYFLPDASAVWFIDGEMLGGAASVATLVILGPAIQNVFDNITDTLNGTPAPAATPTPTPNLMANLDVELLMDRLTRFLRYMTASVQPVENGALIRVTLTLGQ